MGRRTAMIADRQDAVEPRARERILLAAREMFAEHGYSAASISKIAGRAGVLPGSLYWAFESKERLFAEALTAAAEEWRSRFLPPGQDEPRTIEALHEQFLLFASGFVEGPEFLRLIMIVATEHQAGSPALREAASAVRRFWRDSLEAALKAALTGYDPDGVAALARRIGRMVLQLLDGVFMSLQIEQTELTAHELFVEVADIFDRELRFGVSRLARSP